MNRVDIEWVINQMHTTPPPPALVAWWCESQCVWCLGSYNYFHCNHRHNDSHIISEIMTQPHVTKPVTTLSRVRQPIIIACARPPDFTPNQTWNNISDTLFQILYLKNERVVIEGHQFVSTRARQQKMITWDRDQWSSIGILQQAPHCRGQFYCRSGRCRKVIYITQQQRSEQLSGSYLALHTPNIQTV